MPQKPQEPLVLPRRDPWEDPTGPQQVLPMKCRRQTVKSVLILLGFGPRRVQVVDNCPVHLATWLPRFRFARSPMAHAGGRSTRSSKRALLGGGLAGSRKIRAIKKSEEPVKKIPKSPTSQ
jgi:hypothetical protein